MSLENYPSFVLDFSECEVNGTERHFYHFKSFRLDVGERQLLHDFVPVDLTPKAFDVLALLVENGGRLIEKDELLRQVWPDSFVEEANIPRIIHTLRRTLGHDDNGNKLIETVPTKGYRFVADVTEEIVPVPEPSSHADESGLHNELIYPATANPKPRTRIILFTVGFLVAILLMALLSFNFQSNSVTNSSKPKSIAILPLRALTDNSRDSIYELAIADSLISKLSTAKNLTIRPLSAMQKYVETEMDAVTIGKEQKVNYVLASNYQIIDDKIRITAQLINVENGAVEETFKAEHSIGDSFAMQDAVASNIGQMLLKRLNPQSYDVATKRYTTNEEAYRLYLQGMALTGKRNRQDAEKAIEYLEQAVQFDPNYALAYAQLANAYGTLALFGTDKIENRLKEQAAIEKALALDENLAEAHAALGGSKLNYEWDFAGAEKAFKKALELDPNSIAAHRLYAVYLSSMGRHDEAIAEAKIAIDLEPASVQNYKNYGQFLYFARRYDEAVPVLERAVEMDKNFRTTYGWLIGSLQMKGEDDKAFEYFLRAPHRKDDGPEKIQLWKSIYAKSGWRGIKQKHLEDALEEEEKTRKPAWNLPDLYAKTGDNEKAIISLQKAFENNRRGWGWTTLNIDPSYDAIRSDPRFEEIVRRIGLK